jgi:hypothetical protein
MVGTAHLSNAKLMAVSATSHNSTEFFPGRGMNSVLQEAYKPARLLVLQLDGDGSGHTVLRDTRPHSLLIVKCPVYMACCELRALADGQRTSIEADWMHWCTLISAQPNSAVSA